MILSDKWHMCVSRGPIENDGDLSNKTIIGTEHRLREMAGQKIVRGIWDCVWIFPPGSDSSPDATHPDNPYWVGESGWGGYMSWIHLDE